MAKRASLIYQIMAVIKIILAFGKSKRDAKKNGTFKEKIYSYKTLKNTLSVCVDFARFCKGEFNIKSIYDFKKEHYCAYLEQKANKNCSTGHLKNIETGLRKLQIAMNKQAEMYSKSPTIFCTEERIYNAKNSKNMPKDRSVSIEEAELIIHNIKSVEVRKALKLQLYLGFRSKESVKLMPQHVNFEKGEIIIRNGKGITKGGRPRDIKIPDTFIEELKSIVANRPSNEPIAKISESSLRRSVLKSGKLLGIKTSGCHMFRHTFARERFNFLLAEDADEGRNLLKHMLKQRSLGRRPDNGITKEYREIYKKVQNAMNIVHSEMGHGKSRYDLAEVYLK